MKKDKKGNRALGTKAAFLAGMLGKAMVIAALAFGLVLTGCPTEVEETPAPFAWPADIAGTEWRNSDGRTIRFNADNTFFDSRMNGGESDNTYTVTGFRLWTGSVSGEYYDFTAKKEGLWDMDCTYTITSATTISYSGQLYGDPEFSTYTNTALSGTITISPATATTGTQLTAAYSDGAGTVSYQWNKDGTAISGATGRTYTPGEAGSYTVTVSATGFKSKTSDPVTVTGDTILTLSGTIAISPTAATPGTLLTATYSGGTETVSYQWQKDGTDVASGGTGTTYTPDIAGTYTVTVSAAGYLSKTSAPATVTAPTGNSKAMAIPLTADTLTDGSITAGGEKWYSFTAASGTSYEVSWQDSDQKASGASYTVDVEVTAYAGASTTALSGFDAVDRGYTTPKTISGQAGTIYLKVAGYNSNSNGTFAIKYAPTAAASEGSTRATAIPLTANTLTDGSITAGGEKWYSFTAASGTSYEVSWQDSDQKASGASYTLDVKVTAYAGASTTAITSFDAVDRGYTTPKTISGQTGTIYLKVVGYNSTTSGTFAIKYAPTAAASEGSTRATAIPLTANTLTDGSITAGGEKWYSFTAASGTSYEVSWQDSFQKASGASYTADVYVTAYAGSSTTALSGFDREDSGYTYPKIISGQSGVIYLKLVGLNSITAGTFAIKYAPTAAASEGSTMATAIPLTANTWGSGNLASNGAQWFKFTATASTQYFHLHPSFGTLDDLHIQLYNSTGSTVGTASNLWNWSMSSTPLQTSKSVTSGNVYYVKVWPDGSTKSGTYKLAFNTSSTAPTP
ncbi:hypothetical protein AGMMS50267_03770 [Spirochaetia bacterium]|nr:hypothetical protein AGMMS50267_03770 [Spirochaetia bacterium]